MQVRCSTCQTRTDFTLTDWRCPCGGAWEPAGLPPFEPTRIDTSRTSIWRYGPLLGLDLTAPVRPMGVGRTPLVPLSWDGLVVHLKLAYLTPSGSFKDRGVNAMVNQLVVMGATALIEDSSGNAGASLAAHAARFGLSADIYVPASATPAKCRQIALYGARVIPIPGERRNAEIAAQTAVENGKVYASHAYNPAYLAGQITAAYELWEQMNRHAPDWIIIPVGQGGLLLGYYFGFRQILDAGLIERLPRLVAVQSAQVAPLHQAHRTGATPHSLVEAGGTTVADGIAITHPVRATRLLKAITESHGTTLAVEEADILAAQHRLALAGYDVEPTSAVAMVGLDQLRSEIKPEDTVVIPLTGNGLKSVRVDLPSQTPES